MSVWPFFANLFEPRNAAAIEQVQRQARLGVEADGTRRAAAAPPEGR